MDVNRLEAAPHHYVRGDSCNETIVRHRRSPARGLGVHLPVMGWGFRRSVKLGPLKLNFSKSGVGYSVGARGFRVGKDAKGRSYTAASIPGTGLYSRKYSSQGKAAGGSAAPLPGAAPRTNSGLAVVLGLLALAFMAGGAGWLSVRWNAVVEHKAQTHLRGFALVSRLVRAAYLAGGWPRSDSPEKVWVTGGPGLTLPTKSGCPMSGFSDMGCRMLA